LVGVWFLGWPLFGVGAFLGGFVVVGYGGFCRWGFSVFRGGWGGYMGFGYVLQSTYTITSGHRISSPSFLSLSFPRRLGPIEQIAICPSQPLNFLPSTPSFETLFISITLPRRFLNVRFESSWFWRGWMFARFARGRGDGDHGWE